MSRADEERATLVRAGFTRDPNFFGWSMTTFNGDRFEVLERDIRRHTGPMPIRWRWGDEVAI